MAYNTCSEITDDLIPHGGIIVFDWDNTLKLYDHKNKQISSRVDKESLQRWKHDKQCDMYVISAIYPSKINLDTLLFEVNKLNLLEFFIKEDDKVEVKAGKFARKGNIIICGYDKAEMFIEVTQHKWGTQLLGKPGETEVTDEYDSMDSGFISGQWSAAECNLEGAMEKRVLNHDKVVFFDDEEINIINFSALVQNSKCFLVK